MDTTLDEWEILQAVVQTGGFAPAAEQLARSQSTISYAVARLQQRLGVKLFELKGRKAHLTEVGRVLLADAEPHLAGFHQLEQAFCRSRGIRPSVPPCSAETSPVHLPVRGFRVLRPQYAALRDRLGVARVVRQANPGDQDACARSAGPPAPLRKKVAAIDLMQHMPVIIEGGTVGATKRQPRSPAQRFLAVSTIEAAIDAVRSGLCFGWLPRYRIQSCLEDGELLPLRMMVGQTRDVRLSVVCKDSSSSNRELNALADLLGVNRGVEVM